MTLARSSAPSVARPSSVAGDGGGDVESEYMSKVSGRSKSRMGTQVCSKIANPVCAVIIVFVMVVVATMFMITAGLDG